MNRILALLLFVVAVVAGWKVYSAVKPVDQASATAPLTAEPNAKICFVPFHDFPMSQLETLRRYYKRKYNVEVLITKTVPVNPSLRDTLRGQLRAEDRAASLRRALPQFDRNTILIGFTSEDIYPVSKDWQFAFGWRSSQTQSAVVSTARLALPYQGLPAGADVSTARMRKVVTKDIGILYFGLPQSSNPKSVLYSQILGIEELDNVGEDF